MTLESHPAPDHQPGLTLGGRAADGRSTEPPAQCQGPPTTVPPNVANVQDPSAHPVYVRTGQGDFYEDINFRLIPYYNTPGLARPPGTLYPLQTVRDGRMGSR
jgi:hypothetical protein